MKPLFLCILIAALAASSASADSCPGSASDQCVASTCPAGAPKVGPRHPRVVRAVLIQNAINALPAGTVICVRPATYVGQINFNGKPLTLVSSVPLGATLDGGGLTTPVTFNTNEGAASVLDGFRITGGVAGLGSSSGAGGGIFISNASPTIRNCLVTGNLATGSPAKGGGAYITGSSAAPAISCTRFESNHADFAGGALYTAYLAHPYLSYDTLATNTATYGAGLAAGFSGLTNIENSDCFGNVAAADGGCLHVLTQFGHTFVRRTSITGNTASGNGGGAWVPAGFATILNSVFDNNSAFNGGAAAAGFDGVLTVESTIFVNNVTSGSPSAALSADSSPAGTTILSNFNLFHGNSGGNSLGTLGNAGILTADPLFVNPCYGLGAGSPALASGLPDIHFNNAPANGGGRNDMGIHGGPIVP